MPAGVVIGNSRRFTRSLENPLARFLFEYADSLQRFPVVFDAGDAGVDLDGGDLIVLDEDTLLLGVDNRTSRDAAPALAEALDMEAAHRAAGRRAPLPADAAGPAGLMTPVFRRVDAALPGG